MARRRVLLFGWASKVQVHLFRWAHGLKDRGLEVKIVALGGTPIDGIETINLPRKGKLSYFRQARAAIAEAHAFNPDIVHAHYATGYGYWACRTGIRPSIVSVWGSDVINATGVWYKRAIVRKVLRRATCITATSQYLKQKTLDIFPGAQDKISIIPFGVDLPELQQFFPVGGPIKMCFIKHHTFTYGPDVLLKAMVEVKKVLPAVRLSMAGTGVLEDYLKQLATSLDVNDVVDFVGFIPHDKMYDFISEHDFMVMPSLEDAFGVAVLEASACGRPVIASNVGGVPEVLVDNVTGILVPKNDVNSLAEAIIKLARDADLRARLGRAGYEFVKQNYTWDKSLDMMTELYERLIYEKK